MDKQILEYEVDKFPSLCKGVGMNEFKLMNLAMFGYFNIVRE